MKSTLLNLYRFIFCRKHLYKFNTHLHNLSLRGLGILNSEGPDITGENNFFKNILSKYDISVVFDIGANTGGYAQLVRDLLPQAAIYSFEPNPNIFNELSKSTKDSKIKIYQIGLSDIRGKAKLWDFADDAKLKSTQPTSTLSSVYKEVITKFHKQKPKSYEIKTDTIDNFCNDKKIKRIDFLKVDTEGSEYEVLKGASAMLLKNNIKIIQFEFNEMNVYSRVFFKDFVDLLENYNLYRLLPYGLFPISNYQPKHHEIFAFQNIIAINKSAKLR